MHAGACRWQPQILWEGGREGEKLKAIGKKPSLYLDLPWLVQLLGGFSVTLYFPEGSRKLWTKILHGGGCRG